MNQRMRFILIVAGAGVALAVVSAVLAASLASDGDDSDQEIIVRRGDRLTVVTPTARASTLDELPAELRRRIDALPERLRQQVLRAIDEGRMAGRAIEDLLEQYESRNPAVRAGSVIEASDSELTLEVYTTGERVEIAINDKTVLRRGRDAIEGSDLQRGELVMVLSMDGGKTAFSVTAFGVSPP